MIWPSERGTALVEKNEKDDAVFDGLHFLASSAIQDPTAGVASIRREESLRDHTKGAQRASKTKRRVIYVSQQEFDALATKTGAKFQTSSSGGRRATVDQSELLSLAPAVKGNAVLCGGVVCATRKHVCVNSECVCPVLYVERKHTCISLQETGLPEWCSARLPRKVLRAAKHGGDHDLNHLADYGSCAVVGSAGRLVHEATPTQGLEIDNHTAVIRFNDAPTSSTFPQVGTKTTLRIQNRDYCGWSEGKEYCLPYSTTNIGGHIERQCEEAMRSKLSKCRALYPSSKLMHFVHNYWQENKPENIVARRAKLSAGFFGIVLAINICGSVDIYGFGDNKRHEGGGNYFNKSKGSRGWKALSLKHSWEVEHSCLQIIREQGLSRNLKIRVH